MSVEHGPQGHESNERSQAELNELGREQLDSLRANPEAAAEHQEKRAVEAREAIERQASEDAAKPVEAAPVARPTFAAKLDHVLNYSQTLSSVQRRLSPVSRGFSKVIHAPAVEATSEALEKTVMRPSVVAGALWTAAIVGLIFYLVARHYGYVLSGFEMLAALVAGAALGLVFEFIARALRRRG